MDNSSSTPNQKGYSKGKPFRTQKETIFQYLLNHVATASMVTETTGIPQKNICRYKRDLEKSGILWEVKKDYCQATGCKAWYITTNPKFSPPNNQLILFDNES